MTTYGFGEIAEKLRRATVRIDAGAGSGSGVIWSADGLVVTNAHVVRDTTPVVELWDGRRVRASLVSRDRRADLASLRVDAAGLTPPEYRSSDEVQVGEIAIAVGNPMGFLGAVTRGIVHAIGPSGRFGLRKWIHSDVRLAPGNSGGPLADAQGRVIGVNTMVVGRMGLAIPSLTLADFVRNGSRDIVLGVTVMPVRYRTGDSLALGLRILEIEPGSLADRSALLAGDVLIGAGKGMFGSPDDLLDALQESGRVARLKVLRPGASGPREIAVHLGEWAAEVA